MQNCRGRHVKWDAEKLCSVLKTKLLQYGFAPSIWSNPSKIIPKFDHSQMPPFLPSSQSLSLSLSLYILNQYPCPFELISDFFFFFGNLGNGLCSSSSLAAETLSSHLWAFDSKLKCRGNQVRRIWMSPVCMGRRSCKIAGRKVHNFKSLS